VILEEILNKQYDEIACSGFVCTRIETTSVLLLTGQ